MSVENVMLLYPGDPRKNKDDVFETTDLVSFAKGDFSHKGYLRFVKVVEDGKLFEKLGEKVLDGFIEIKK
ncbi:hypothetical protein [Brumimicrobium mesophilum]|uniref:hypothetical protein n=1 Tax=Brumimicrobium mesophilum TaxID=392717 RepID=UPI00131B7CF1|nr:hypothetical protein [Brumimicrobium mesophilum]